LRSLRQYLIDEAADKLQQTWDAESFSFRFATEMPQQNNGDDCGVYVVRTAKEISGGNRLNYGPGEMTQYRMLILKELQAGHLL